MMKLTRNAYKLFYKKLRKSDGKIIGRRLDFLTNQLLKQYKKLPEERDKTIIEQYLAEAIELKKEKRFRQDFPSFAVFYKYCKKNEVFLKDLQEVEELYQ